ncbi:cupin domain-containing protein [Streptomyces sp. NPDC004012]
MTTSTSPARKTQVIREAELEFVSGHPSEPGEGVRLAEYLGPDKGAVHFTVCIVELQPGAVIHGHVHPFEESFFVLEGTALVNLGGMCHRLVPGDFGVIPIAHGHAWANTSDEPARLLRVYAPQQRPIAGTGGWGVFAAPDVEVPTSGHRIDELHPRHTLLGHFDDSDLAPPGSISMPGYHGANIQDVSIRMMVDELLGARHHTMFVVEFVPTGEPTLSANEHFHPFEEAYYFLSGQASGSFDGVRVPVAAGDLAFAGVGASHGFSAVGDESVRWIEVQAPLPPSSHAFTFHRDWTKLDSLG